jgi:menaquinone-dependent protoporphyrinogen oxidase
MSAKPFSRRDFLKLGCATVAAAGVTVCGVSAAAPEPTPIILKSFTYGEANMNNHILIAYASATGSTIEVAAEIGKTLAAGGLAVDVKPAREVTSIEEYQAALIGSAAQHGNWLPEAVEFVKTNQQALNRMPVALFTVHIANLVNDESSRQKRLAYLNEVRPLLRPRDEVFFAGRFDRRGAALLLPAWLAGFVPPMDFRDWKKIRNWADSIRPQLQQF